jgi:predicted transcriptional regulator
LISHDLVHEEKNGNYKATPAGDALLENLERMNEGSSENNS